MDWTAYLDAYCERTAPGLWGEPLNAATNLAFWVAAAWVFVAARRRGLPTGGAMGLLLGLLLLIGMASLTFHTTARRWAALADSAAIALYLLAWLPVYLHRAWGSPWRWAWTGAPVFLALALAAQWAWARAGMSPAAYLGAWTVLLLVAADALRRDRRVGWPLLAAALVFAASVTLRQADLPLCTRWRWGTHFAWHLLNGLTLGLATWSLALAGARTVQSAPGSAPA